MVMGEKMKKWLSPLWLLPLLCAIILAGCDDINWFPDAVDSTSNNGTNTSTDTSSSHNGDSTATESAFVNKCGVTPGSEVTSNALLVQGLTGQGSIRLVGSGSLYSINEGPYTYAWGLVDNGQSVTVRHTAAAAGAANTITVTTLKIADKTYTFKSDTNACPAGSTTFP